jgi:hypothetical protein
MDTPPALSQRGTALPLLIGSASSRTTYFMGRFVKPKRSCGCESVLGCRSDWPRRAKPETFTSSPFFDDDRT